MDSKAAEVPTEVEAFSQLVAMLISQTAKTGSLISVACMRWIFKIYILALHSKLG
jgi:hypothetical protein